MRRSPDRWTIISSSLVAHARTPYSGKKPKKATLSASIPCTSQPSTKPQFHLPPLNPMFLRLYLTSLLPLASCFTSFTPPEPLPTIFSSKSQCIYTYSQCMQDLALCWNQQRHGDLIICDMWQDLCEGIYGRCGEVEIDLKWAVYEMTEAERCMAEYDVCLDLQKECLETHDEFNKRNSRENEGSCSNITRECQKILESCYNTGAVEDLHPTGTLLTDYIASWSPPETFLDPSPTITNTHCLPLYNQCTSFYTTCIQQLPHPTSLNHTSIDFEHHAKACYQILLRCKYLTSCPLNVSLPLATWIPASVAKGVQVPPWDPPDALGLASNKEWNRCMRGYHRCLIMLRDCLMEAKLLEEGGWWERAERQRNICQIELVPVCVRGVEVCKKFGEGG